MAKYTVDCFTKKSRGSAFPENTYEVETIGDVAKILHNCTRRISGIREVRVHIEVPDDRESVTTASA